MGESGGWIYGENPCRYCTEETGRCADPNCHGYCERFLEWERQKNERKSIIRKEQVIFGKVSSVEQARMKRIGKRKSRNHR